MMQRLGEILIERGVLSLAELHTALEACHRTGGRLGTQLLEYGYVEERMLVDALAKQHGVPGVVKVKLLHAPLEVRKMLPPAVGRRLQAVPFEDTTAGVKVAMTNPADRAATDEISTQLKKNVLPHVATEEAVLAALGGAENDDADWSTGVEPSAVRAPGTDDLEGWSALWQPPRFDPTALLSEPSSRDGRPEVLVASYPDLMPVGQDGVAAPQSPVEESDFSELLHRADQRDEIGSLVTRYAASLYDRVGLFSVHKGRVNGWMARGRSVVVEDVQTFSIALDEPSIFAEVGQSDSYVGALSSCRANERLVGALNDPAPTEVVLVPVRVKQRVVAYVLCDDPGHPASNEHVAPLVAAARKAGVAFEVLILRRKLLS